MIFELPRITNPDTIPQPRKRHGFRADIVGVESLPERTENTEASFISEELEDFRYFWVIGLAAALPGDSEESPPSMPVTNL